MNFSEKNLEEDILEKLQEEDFESLYNKGFEYYDPEEEREFFHAQSQVDLSPYGIADIICTRLYKTYHRSKELDYTELCIEMDIIELKARYIKSKDIDQVLRYKRAIERYVENKYKQDNKYCYEVEVNCILIGSGIEHGHYIHNHIGDQLYIYTYTSNLIDGIQFEFQDIGWIKTNDEDYIESMDKNLIYVGCINEFAMPDLEPRKK